MTIIYGAWQLGGAPSSEEGEGPGESYVATLREAPRRGTRGERASGNGERVTLASLYRHGWPKGLLPVRAAPRGGARRGASRAHDERGARLGGIRVQ